MLRQEGPALPQRPFQHAELHMAITADMSAMKHTMPYSTMHQ